MRKIPRLCLTGGPCAGKSTALSYIKQKLSERGWYPVLVPEAATLMLSGNISPKHFGLMPFQQSIIRTVLDLEQTFLRAASQLPETLRPVLICDRGIADSAAYMSPEAYLDALRECGIESAVAGRDKHYDAVFHLVSAAVGAEEFYGNASNITRLETVEEAKILDTRTRDAWIGHPHLRVIDNSTDFASKLCRLDEEICSALGIPVPLEIERKFLCEPVHISQLPNGAQVINIVQVYLMSAPDVVARVRQRGQYGSYTYYRTEKRQVSPGVVSEIERMITEEEYLLSLQFQHPDTLAVHKTRTCFIYNNQYFELDCIVRRNDVPLYVLEIELTKENSVCELPPFITVIKEVTANQLFSNRALAESNQYRK